ncbi:16S rRNA (cytosine(1402)-N(4))-methyltransferase RsmH [Candidatus Uhrbacteria bacterium UHB]|nr:16S rRNA (cytosine(1402)-N(4))-methyltransferase RsmH [Candidatus Uhrbacteria bacterium UHB]RIL01233.1 MAG: 16S rRNA (cytosine(1402)-N(4))-methyltransferase [Candidatus Uhrbacteria bacterium]
MRSLNGSATVGSNAMASLHKAVMTQAVIDAISSKQDGRYADGTLGGAAHTRALLNASAPHGRVLSLDLDPKAIEAARTLLAPYGERWIGVEANFRHIDRIADENGMTPLDGIILDLGLSSDELLDASKGLSFQIDGPLDMRLGPKANEDGMTAAEIVNTWSQEELGKMLRVFGEEPHAYRIAKEIVRARKAARIVGTLDLVSIIKRSAPSSPHSRIHPATRTFQALRIAVNDELESLKQAIQAAYRALKPGGRLAVLSFHSLEDRIVKRAFAGPEWNVITKKPITPDEKEIRENPRSRSAKLRVAEKAVQS